MNKILVLLSTYNGEKYIRQQLDSLINQKYVDVNILIRDDGSTDGTISIINEYVNDKIHLIVGKENLGPAYSFIELLFLAGDFDFYAYCDQDDIWMLNKLFVASEKLKNIEKPALYMSTYDVVDHDLNYIRKRNMEFDFPFTLEEVIVTRCPSGCTMVFNKQLKKILTQGRPEFIRMHDYWTLMTVLYYKGEIVVDNESRLMYRQHANNAVGVSAGCVTRWKRLWNSATKKPNERQKQALSLVGVYGQSSYIDINNILSKVRDYRMTMRNKISFAFDKNFIPRNLSDRILFIISVMLGVF